MPQAAFKYKYLQLEQKNHQKAAAGQKVKSFLRFTGNFPHLSLSPPLSPSLSFTHTALIYLCPAHCRCPWSLARERKSAGGFCWIRVASRINKLQLFAGHNKHNNKYLGKKSKNVTITNEKQKWAQKLKMQNKKKRRKSCIYYFGYKRSVKNLLSFKMFLVFFSPISLSFLILLLLFAGVKVANNCEQI